MRKIRQWQVVLLRSRWLSVVVISLTLLVLGTTIYVARWQLRDEIRGQIAGRDGEVLYQAVQLLQTRDGGGEEMIGGIEDPGEQFNLILKASRMKGVLAVRLFAPDGTFANGLPAGVVEENLASPDLAKVLQLKPVCRFFEQAHLKSIFYTASEKTSEPLLEVSIPLHQPGASRVVGIAQFIIEGRSIATEYAKLDQHLTRQALAAFLAGGGVLTLALGWAFRRLAERTRNLQRVNQQLALAARTSALGAVTAHLIHGLKNPLAGLQTFVASRGGQNSDGDPDWEEAGASTRRMGALINEVVSVLREEREGEHYELTTAEMAELVAVRTAAVVQERGVELTANVKTGRMICNRTANLAGLILGNLVQNAAQATPRGKRIELDISMRGDDLVFAVSDQGSGLPVEIADNLFAPCSSTKRGGCGIGLAISKQLANHLGARLELKSNTPQGCCFELVLPAIVLAGTSETAQV